MPTTVRVPDAFIPLFDQAERYVLVRAASLTTGFLDVMRDLIGEARVVRKPIEAPLREGRGAPFE